MLRWLTSFVSDRSQYVAVGSERSETCALSSGVPQGSVLGPLMFALYTSEVDAVIESYAVQYHQYADELTVCLSLAPIAPKAFGDLSSAVSRSDAVSSWFLQNAVIEPGQNRGTNFRHTSTSVGGDLTRALHGL